MNKKGIYTANHCGGLNEALETEKPITLITFKRLIKADIYVFYCYDERIDANRYLLNDITGNLGLPQWINDYEKITFEKYDIQ